MTPLIIGVNRSAPLTPGDLTKRVAAVRDAITRNNSGYFAETDPLYWAETGGAVQRTALRWTSLNIPIGATITSCVITIYNAQNQGTPTANDTVQVGFEQTDSATQVTNSADILSRAGNIGSTINWLYSVTPNNQPNPSPDLSTILQPVIDRPGRSATFNLQAVVIAPGTATQSTQMRSYYNGASGTYPLIEIGWLA